MRYKSPGTAAERDGATPGTRSRDEPAFAEVDQAHGGPYGWTWRMWCRPSVALVYVSVTSASGRGRSQPVRALGEVTPLPTEPADLLIRPLRPLAGGARLDEGV